VVVLLEEQPEPTTSEAVSSVPTQAAAGFRFFIVIL
jgi:hypothetical protein